MKDYQHVAVILIMMLLMQPITAIKWQGTGNFSDSNLTQIWAFIHPNLRRVNSVYTMHSFNTELSNTLNTLWDPAWNVFTIQFSIGETNFDVVLYGYAFRNHWLWFNGYTDDLIPGYCYAFVIWKDYNCQGWMNVGQRSGTSTGFSPAQRNLLSQYITAALGQLETDPWAMAKALVDRVQSSGYFSPVTGQNAYSIVLNQDFSNSLMYGRICLVGSNFYYSDTELYGAIKVDGVNSYGTLILFQTR